MVTLVGDEEEMTNLAGNRVVSGRAREIIPRHHGSLWCLRRREELCGAGEEEKNGNEEDILVAGGGSIGGSGGCGPIS